MNSELHALAGAYAVDALPGDEREDFERHLASCGACRAEVAEMRATAARLGSAASAPPPPALRDRVLAEVDQVRQVPPRVDAAVPTGGAPDGDAAGAGSPAVSTLPGRAGGQRHRRPRRRTHQLVAVAACVLLVVAAGLGALVVDLRGRVHGAETANQALTQALGAPDARDLHASTSGGGTGTVVVSRQRHLAVFLASGFEPAPSGRTYQLWFVGRHGPVSAGLFEPGSDGRAIRVLDGAVGSAKAVAVTLEPDGGSQQPTSAPIVTVSLSA